MDVLKCNTETGRNIVQSPLVPTMLFYLLLSFAMTAIFNCRKITIRNNCRDEVWFQTDASYEDEVKFEVNLPLEIRTTSRKITRWSVPDIVYDLDIPTKFVRKNTKRNFGLAPGRNVSYAVSNFRYHEDIYPITGCDSNGANCASLSSDDVPMSRVSFQLSEATDASFDDYYEIDIRYGYHVPISVTPLGKGFCESLFCNLTLDDCPTNETFDIGDLRVIVDDHTVACQSSCRKRRVEKITWRYIGDNTRSCPPYHRPPLMYSEMVNRKCPGITRVHNDPPDEFFFGKRCLTGGSFDVVLCP